MIKKDKILSLFLVLLMVTAAAITVNKAIFGYNIEQTETVQNESVVESEAISTGTDGTITIHTAALEGTIDGYAGPVPLDIYLKDGKITRIQALPNAETPSFFRRVTNLLSSWDGETPEDAISMNVDGVSGATYSSNAIINNVKVGLAHYEGVKAQLSTSVPIKIWIALAVTLAACIVPLFVRSKIYHTVQMIANVLVLGFWAGQFLDYSLILKYTSSGFTLPSALVTIVMLIAAFIYPIFGRPQHFCTHICPLGSAQQIMGQICGYKIILSPKAVKGLDWFRKILWAVLMLLLWADCLTGWMDLELFQAFQFESASAGIIIAAIIFVLLSLVISRPYCRFVCPTGSLFKRSENIG